MSEIQRWEPENTIVGYNMKPCADGSFVLFDVASKSESALRQQLADVSNERDFWRRRAEWMLRNNGLLDLWATSWVSSGDKPLTQHLSEKVDRALRDEPINIAQSAPASRPQAERVHECQKCYGRGLMPTREAGEGENEYRTRCKLYAEQSAPATTTNEGSPQ